jgi:hypothetical protein
MNVVSELADLESVSGAQHIGDEAYTGAPAPPEMRRTPQPRIVSSFDE